MDARRFLVVLVKPSHYDDEGYVIQWVRSPIPSNSLASMHGLIEDCHREKALGDDVSIEVEAYDECNTTINVKAVARRIRQAGGGFVALVGVQSNQFPRALDLGREFRALGTTVAVGGFHVSGCLSMLPGLTPELTEAKDLGIILYAGEGEGRMASFLRDVDSGGTKPIYNYLADLPDMDRAVLPLLPPEVVTRVAGRYSSFDAGRGCPFQCSFCTIINVQGRKSRFRTPDDVEAIVRANAKQGITRFFVTDDNFARNRNWEPILDRLIELREGEKMSIRLILQVDTLCHRIPNFIEKAARAGCNSVFIGLENINPQSLMGAKKRQNKIWEYRAMLQAWRARKVMTWGGYILGFPTDTPESIRRDIEIIQRELPIDILEFFCLTPLPGSEDHKVLVTKNVAVDPDLNKYDLEHVCTAHPVMTKEAWEKIYAQAWSIYYTDAHVETLMRRAVVSGIKLSKLMRVMIAFSGASTIEGLHPLQCGVIRLKPRLGRRHGLPIINPLIFYPRRTAEMAVTIWRWLAKYRAYNAIMKRVAADPDGRAYMDDALQPVVAGHEAEEHIVEIFGDMIPKTHGAPVRKMAAAAAAG